MNAPTLSTPPAGPGLRQRISGGLLAVCLAFAAAAPANAADDPAALKADAAAFFTDPSCSELKPEIGKDQLASFRSGLLRSVAEALLNGSYDSTYRTASFAASPSPRALAEELKLGQGFSRYEGITGMVLEEGENVVFVGETGGKEIQLLVPYWMRKPAEGVEPTKDPNGWGLQRQVIDLKEGVNVIDLVRRGNVYVSYYEDDAEEAPEIRVHFPTGDINGFFDAAIHDNDDWDRLLENAVSPIMDARGKHIQVAYPVEWLKVHAGGRGTELINNYDTLLNHHYTFMGLVKYDLVPKNRILSRVNFNYYMFRDVDGVAYLGTRNVMGMVANPDSVIKGDPCWGFSHEAGHVLQMIPQITWSGMMEVSVNLFSLYTVGAMGNPCRLKAQNNYQTARKRIIEADPKISYLQTESVFDRLVPFWQLHLYFKENGKPDFYAEVMTEMRKRPHAGTGRDSIRNQYEFVKICSDVAQLDLRDFFEQWGFFYVGEISGNDYGRFRFEATQEMIDEVISYLDEKGYPKPKDDITLVTS